MRRVYFVVEGQTEAEFVKEVIAPYFQSAEIYDTRPIIIETSRGNKGGFVNFQHLKKLLVRLIKEEPDVVVTTMVDFFRVPNDLPGYAECIKFNSSSDKIECLQSYLTEDIHRTVNSPLFIPYIQQHEFEALLFSSNAGFEYCFDKEVYYKTGQVIEQFPNPEEINSHPKTAPSKRLLEIIPDYQKVIDGNTIAMEIGIETLLQKCPRFRAWIESLISKAKA